MNTISVLLSLALVLAGGSAPATETPNAAAPAAAKKMKVEEFTGFDKANFGTRYEEVLKRYPKAEVLADGQDLGAATVGGPYIQRLVLRDQPVAGLQHPTMVELRFWKKKLWSVVVYFGANSDQEVLTMLTTRFGPDHGKDPNNPLWVHDKTQTTAAVKQRWYGISDLALSQEAQTWFGLVLKGLWKAPTEEEIVELGLKPRAPTQPPISPAGAGTKTKTPSAAPAR